MANRALTFNGSDDHYRNRLVELVQEGVIDANTLAIMVAKWMTEDDIEEMLDANELSERFERLEEDN